MLKTKLQKKYPTYKIKYEPQENCGACGGTGEYDDTLCICTCVSIANIGGDYKDFMGFRLLSIMEHRNNAYAKYAKRLGIRQLTVEEKAHAIKHVMLQ